MFILAPEMTKSEYGRGQNPNSHKHAKFNKGRPKFRDIWGEDAITRSFSITKKAVEEMDRAVQAAGFDNRSDYLQHIGSNLVPVLPKEFDYEMLEGILKNTVGIDNIEELLKAIISGEVELIRNDDELN